MNLFTIDHIIVYTFLIMTLLIGLYYGKGIKTVREYAVANKEYGVIIITFTLLATAIGGGTTIGNITEISKSGIIAFFAEMGVIVGVVLLGFLVRKFRHKKFVNAITVADVIEVFYDKKLSIFTAFIGFICSIGKLAAQIIAVGLLLSTFFGLDYALAIIICGGVLVLYSSFGGIKSVVVTDIIQFAALIIVIPLMTYFAYFQAIETTDIYSKISNDMVGAWGKFDFNYTCYFFVCALPFMWLHPAFMQRILMVKNPENIVISINSYAIILCLILPLLLIATYSINSLIPGVAPKDVLATFISEKIPVVVKGIAIMGLLAAIMSTADSLLNASGVLFVHNFLKPLFKIEKELQLMRATSLTIGVFAITVAIQKVGFVELIIGISGIWGAFVGVPLVMALLGLKVNKADFYSSIIVSPIAYYYFVRNHNAYVAPMMILLFSFLAFFITNLIRNKGLVFEKDEELACKDSIKKEKSVSIYESIVFAFKNHPPTLNNVLKWINEKVLQQGINHWLFCVYFWICLIGSFPFWMRELSYFHMPAITLPVIISGVMSIVLIIREAWSDRSLRYYPLYWYITLMVCLPFLHTLMLCLNQGDTFEVVGLMVAIMILALLVDWLSFLILSILGISLGYVYFCIFFDADTICVDSLVKPENTLKYIIGVLSIITIVFMRTKDVFFNGKMKTLQAFGGVMAHEVKSPLSSSSSSINLIKMLLNQEAKIKNDGDEVDIKLPKASYEALQRVLQIMDKSNTLGQKTVDMLLMSMKMGGELQGEKEHLSLEQCVNEALEEYGFEDLQQEKIKVALIKDVEFIGDKEYIKHVIFNLIKNAFKHGGSNIEISITIEDDQLIFKDNGRGIPNDKMQYIFEDFYTGSNTGTGLGLAFCRRVMESIGGSIKCYSEQNEYTEFILKFKRVG